MSKRRISWCALCALAACNDKDHVIGPEGERLRKRVTALEKALVSVLDSDVCECNHRDCPWYGEMRKRREKARRVLDSTE